MMPPRALLLCLAIACGCAAEFTPPQEAAKAFAAQAKGAAVGVPSVIGTWVWSGRADAQYKPFFEWDLRLAAGTAALGGLKARITTLGPKQETLREGGWIALGDLRADATRDVALRLNCPTFTAWRLELTWKGGGDTWIGTDRSSLPVSLAGTAEQPVILAVGADAEPGRGGKGAIATWNLWNLGGKPAKDVLQIVRLRGADGAVVAKGELAMAKNEVAAPRSSKACTLAIPAAPAWENVTVEVRMPEVPGAASNVLIPPKPSGPDLVVERITIDGETVTAEVVNRLGKPLDGATLTLVLLAGGKPAKEVQFTIGALAEDATRSVRATASGIPPWDAFSLSWNPVQ